MKPEPPAWAAPVALASLTCLVYLPCLANGFVLDDVFYIALNRAVREPGRWLSFFYDASAISADASLSSIIYRPLLGLSHGLNAWLCGPAPFWFHLHDILLHAGVTALVYLLARRLGARGWAAWAGALLFSLHPVQVQSVAYAGSRAGLLSLFFILLALNAHRDGKARLSWTWFGLALLSKESSVFFAALVPAHDWVYGPVHESWRRRLGRWLPFALLAAAFLACRWAVLGRLSQSGPWGGSWAVHGQLMAHAWFQYLRMALWPAGLREPYGFVMGPHFLAASWAMAAAFLALAAAAVWGLLRRKPWGFAGAWFFLALAPVSQLVPFTCLAADRLLYASMAGLALLACRLVPVRPGRPVQAGLAVLGLWLVLANLGQQLHWRCDFVLAGEACAAAPGEPYAALRLSMPYMNWRMLDRAEALARPALAAGSPPDVRRVGLRRLGQIRMAQKRWAEAEAFLETALALRAGQKTVLSMLAQCARARGDYARAQDLAGRAAALP